MADDDVVDVDGCSVDVDVFSWMVVGLLVIDVDGKRRKLSKVDEMS